MADLQILPEPSPMAADLQTRASPDLQILPEPSPMAADLQTRASSEPSSGSTKRRRKKKSRKRKAAAAADLGHEAERGGDDAAAASEPMDAAVEASTKEDEARASASEPMDVTIEASTKKEDEARDSASKPMDVTVEASTKKEDEARGSASKPMDVTVDASTKKEDEARGSASGSITRSAKKRKRKNTRKLKAAIKRGQKDGEEGVVAPEPTDVTVEASPKKENKPSKTHKAANNPGQEVKSVAAPQPVKLPVEASTPKKENKPSKKNKAAADPVQEEVKSVAAPEPISVAIEAKHSKKHKAIEDPGQEEEVKSVAVPEPVKNLPVETSTPKQGEPSKKRNATNITVDTSLAGGSATASSGPPVVAYFPTGYNPHAAGCSRAPSARLFRNTKHPSRVDLVVPSPSGGTDFVGRSYTGEAALPQLCNYALGVLDKASGTLKIVPIASDKILRLEPNVKVQNPSQSLQSGVTSEAASAVGAGEMRVQDLTSMYGAKKDKDQDKKWKSLNEQTNPLS